MSVAHWALRWQTTVQPYSGGIDTKSEEGGSERRTNETAAVQARRLGNRDEVRSA